MVVVRVVRLVHGRLSIPLTSFTAKLHCNVFRLLEIIVEDKRAAGLLEQVRGRPGVGGRQGLST